MAYPDSLAMDPNRAEEEELRRLPGIGPILAARIVEGRPYGAAEDLLKVSRLGAGTLARIEPNLAFADEAEQGIRRVKAEVFVPVLLTAAATILWFLSLRDIDLDRMTDLGLVSVLPLTFFIALIVLTASFCFALYQRQLRVPVLLLHLVAIIFMLYGTTSLVEEAPRLSSAWRHVGVVESISRTGRIDPTVDAYFNWPGFFILGALATEIGGFRSATSLLGWAPVFFNLLYLSPLVMILSSATRDKRLVWLAVWFFYLTNWIGQDYFSPQALNYFLYLVILGILLKWFNVTTEGPGSLRLFRQIRSFVLWRRSSSHGLVTAVHPANEPSQPGHRAGLLVIIVTIFVAVVSGHQLTPFFTLVAVAALVAFNRSSPRGLPIIVAIMIATWLSYMSVTFLSGHISALIDDVGQFSASYGENLTGRLRGSPDHLVVVYVRILLTSAVWGLALGGGIRRLRNGHWDPTYFLLAAVPFLLLGLQGYGGEMLQRIYLFTLPFMLFFAAALFFPSPLAHTSWWKTGAIGLASVALLGGFLLSRTGNERMDNFTSNEVDAVQYLYAIAEPGSLLIAPARHLPWKFRDYEKFYYRPTGDKILVGEVDAIAGLMESTKYTGAYLILTRSQKATAELLFGLPPTSWERFEQDLRESGIFREVFANEHASILVLAQGSIGAEP